MMPLIEIDRELCKACTFCIDACADEYLALGKTLNSRGYRVVELSGKGSCNSCKRCAVVCPEAAITVFLAEAA
jgi:2-oxoglutarate ferredoxin oxidoreductase subunit delta